MPTRTTRGASKGYATNLASEFFVLSMLYRQGFDASLTLGNQKAVDLVVFRPDELPLTIDVKAVADKMDWIVGAPPRKAVPNHYIVLVSYEGSFANPSSLPKVWVYPHAELIPLISVAANGKTAYVSRKRLIEAGGKYMDAWRLLRT